MSIKAKKGLGQHFLRDVFVIDNIANAVPKSTNRRLMEIGPGEGVLTKRLLPNHPNMIAVEIDKEAIRYLKTTLPTLNIIEHDFLRLDWENLRNDFPFSVVGNLPYYITSPILFSFLDFPERWSSAVFMMQKEVADRLVARPRTKDYGILSVQTQLMADVELLFDVDRNAFYPPPKVTSSVVRLSPKEFPNDVDRELFKKVVKAAFGQRRKMMSNSLKAFMGGAELKSEFNLTRRAEELLPEEFIELTKIWPDIEI